MLASVRSDVKPFDQAATNYPTRSNYVTLIHIPTYPFRPDNTTTSRLRHSTTIRLLIVRNSAFTVVNLEVHSVVTSVYTDEHSLQTSPCQASPSVPSSTPPAPFSLRPPFAQHLVALVNFAPLETPETPSTCSSSACAPARFHHKYPASHHAHAPKTQ